MLVEKFNTALQAASSVTRDPYLARLGSALASVEANIATITELGSYAIALRKLMNNSNFGVDGELTDKFAQTLGEAQFLVMCRDKGVTLQRIPEEKNKKTPDFRAVFGSEAAFFEVKTLSVVNGSWGITSAQESSINANIYIEDQLKRGKRFAIGTSEAQPYANKVEREKTVFGVSNTLLEKTRGNIKSEQFARPNTFLVLNLSVIPPLMNEPKALRPAYPDDYMFPKVVTGELWMMAFGDKGMLVLGNPECEGKPCVEGIFDKVGILTDSEYAFVAGLIFMIHPLSGPSKLFGLFRSNDWHHWHDHNSNLIESLLLLLGNNWNDCGDSNGYNLS